MKHFKNMSIPYILWRFYRGSIYPDHYLCIYRQRSVINRGDILSG